jgi:hypothetical protein
MTVDLRRLDDELESISVDQVAVGRGMLVAREWSTRELSEVDSTLASLASGVDLAAGHAPRSTAAQPERSDLDDLFDESSSDAGSDSPASALASTRDIASDLAAVLEGDDDEFGYDDLEILTDDDLSLTD